MWKQPPTRQTHLVFSLCLNLPQDHGKNPLISQDTNITLSGTAETESDDIQYPLAVIANTRASEGYGSVPPVDPERVFQDAYWGSFSLLCSHPVDLYCCSSLFFHEIALNFHQATILETRTKLLLKQSLVLVRNFAQDAWCGEIYNFFSAIIFHQIWFNNAGLHSFSLLLPILFISTAALELSSLLSKLFWK